ncbi:hypothetical protein Tco_0312643 [Tanacetum coccineum]
MVLSKQQEGGIKDLMRKSKGFGLLKILMAMCYQRLVGNVTFFILYVDDIIIMGTHIPSLQSVKDYLGKCFAMKDWGKQHLFLESKSIEIDGLDKHRLLQTLEEVKRMQNVPYALAWVPLCMLLTLFANEPGVERGARRYHRRYHYVRESIALGEIRFLKVYTDDNLADSFTKALSKGKLTQHARSMGLRLASSFM